MGGSPTTTSTSSTKPSKAVQETTDKLAGGISKAYDAGYDVFDKSLFAGAGPTTQNAWEQALGAANSAGPGFVNSMQGALGDFGATARGDRFGLNDPGFAQLRQGVIDDTMTNINSQFTNSGRFGGGSHVESLGRGVGNAVAGLDYGNFQSDIARQQQAAGMMPGLFGAMQAPSAAVGAVGAAQDANQQGILQGENDLFRRQNDGDRLLLGELSSILAGNAAVGGQTTTQTTPQPSWWQQVLGYVAGNAGQAMKYGAGM
jgi:hypothetical protein